MSVSFNTKKNIFLERKPQVTTLYIIPTVVKCDKITKYNNKLRSYFHTSVGLGYLGVYDYT